MFFTADLRKTTSVVFIRRYRTISRFTAMKGYLKLFFISNLSSIIENLNFTAGSILKTKV